MGNDSESCIQLSLRSSAGTELMIHARVDNPPDYSVIPEWDVIFAFQMCHLFASCFTCCPCSFLAVKLPQLLCS